MNPNRPILDSASHSGQSKTGRPVRLEPEGSNFEMNIPKMAVLSLK